MGYKLISRLFFMGGPKNSFFHLKLIGKMRFYLNFRALKGSVTKTFSVFVTALIFILPVMIVSAQGNAPDPDDVIKQLFSSDKIASETAKEYIIKTKSLVIAQKLGDCLIRGDDSEDKETALYLLGLYQFDEVKTIYLNAFEKTRSFLVKKTIITILGNKKDRAYVVPISKELESEFAAVREIAIKILSEIGDDRMFPVIFKMAEKKEPVYKVYALNALYYLYDFRLLTIELTLLQDENKSVRILAIQCAQKNNIEKTIPILKTLALNDQNIEVRIEAIKALSKMNDQGALNVFTKTIAHENRDVRFATAEALLRAKNRKSLFSVSEQLSIETDPSVKNTLMEILLQMKDGGGFRGLEKMVTGEEYVPLKIKAAYILGVIGGQRSLPLLLKAIADADYKVRAEACNSLGMYRDKNVTSGLVRVIREDSERYVRLSALYSLERIRDRSTVIPLLDLYSIEKDPVFRVKLYEVTRTLIQSSM
jgi:HEAT repeat protein